MTNTDTIDTSKLWDMIKDIKFGMFRTKGGWLGGVLIAGGSDGISSHCTWSRA